MEKSSIDSRWAWLACALIALAALLVNPIGYVGGSGDDARYVEAAQCWAQERLACLPTNHWAARWPVVAPIAVMSTWLGESRAAVALAALPGWLGGLVLLGWLARLWVDRLTGLIAAALLGVTPVFTAAALQPSIDTIELAFQLAALVAATIAYRDQSRPLAIVAGALAALAVQSRDTSILFCGVCALVWLLLEPAPRRKLLWAITGFAGVMAVELTGYWLTTGDPLYRYGLSLAHVQILSQELPAGFDTRQSPLLNPYYIANWRREMGVHIWWPLDPWLNLFASPRIGYLLSGAVLLGITQWRGVEPRVRRLLARVIGAVLLIALTLVYVLAIDPKPRMFLLLAATAALVSGAMVSAAWSGRRHLVPLVIVGLLALLGIFALSRMAHIREFEAVAGRWMMQHPGNVAIDQEAVSTLTLVDGIDQLPLFPSARRYRLAGGNQSCDRYGGILIDQSAVHGSGQICLIDTWPSSPEATRRMAPGRSRPRPHPRPA